MLRPRSTIAQQLSRLALDWQYPGIFGAKDVLDEIVQETAAIMDMWNALERALDDMDPADRAEIEDKYTTVFTGFEATVAPAIWALPKCWSITSVALNGSKAAA